MSEEQVDLLYEIIRHLKVIAHLKMDDDWTIDLFKIVRDMLSKFIPQIDKFLASNAKKEV